MRCPVCKGEGRDEAELSCPVCKGQGQCEVEAALDVVFVALENQRKNNNAIVKKLEYLERWMARVRR